MAEEKSEAKKAEYNPRWKGYVYILLSSLINFCSIANIPKEYRRGYWVASMIFGGFTFSFVALVLLQDRSQRCLKPFHYTKAKDGYFEGYALAFCVVWWIAGVGYITKVAGIAYVANNIYFSAWLSLIACIYTLNEWSTEKDILSIAEITGLSATLKSWWLLNISSMVALGTSIDLHLYIVQDIQDTSFGIALGCVSTVLSFLWLLIHYNFLTFVEEGGWLELSSSFFLILLWTIGVAILTQDEGIGATVTGTMCTRESREIFNQPDCYVVLDAMQNFEYAQAVKCSDFPRQVPGSNMYFAAWTCFAASLNITFRWKAAQALQFAQAQHEKEMQLAKKGEGGGFEKGDDDSDGDDKDDDAI